MDAIVYGSNWDAPVEDAGYDFDPRYGCSLQDLLDFPLPDAPADFADFWRAEYRQMLQHRPQVRIAQRQSLANGRVQETVYYTSTDGCEIGGWLIYPEEEPVTTLLLEGHGYGGRAEPGEPWQDGMAAFYPVVRGQPVLSMKDNLPSVAREHVVHGIGSREDYIIRGCVHDLWVAGTVLLQRFPQVSNLIYCGGSFGGGLGALLLAWDQRFHAGVLRDATFGNQPFRATQRCEGSGAGVYELYRKDPAILSTLAYFDSASAAAWIQQPVFHICSLYDPKVPPPGQFSLWRAQQSEKVLFVKRTGHCEESHAEAEEGMRLAIPFLLEKLFIPR